MATVLVNSFSGNVISTLTVPKMITRINSFEDLAQSHDVGIILLEDTTIGQQILVSLDLKSILPSRFSQTKYINYHQSSTSGALKILSDQAKQNPNRLFNSLAKLLPYLMTKRYAFPYVNMTKVFYVFYILDSLYFSLKRSVNSSLPATLKRMANVVLHRQTACRFPESFHFYYKRTTSLHPNLTQRTL